VIYQRTVGSGRYCNFLIGDRGQDISQVIAEFVRFFPSGEGAECCRPKAAADGDGRRGDRQGADGSQPAAAIEVDLLLGGATAAKPGINRKDIALGITAFRKSLKLFLPSN
jgi:hypothetical protein